MREVLVENHRVAVNTVVAVQQRDDQRREAAVGEPDLAHQVGAAIAVETGVDHFDRGDAGLAALLEAVDARGDLFGVAGGVAVSRVESGNRQYFLDQCRGDAAANVEPAQQLVREIECMNA